MWFCKLIKFLGAVLLCAALMACGYHWTRYSSNSLPADVRNLYLEHVEDPTNFSWLEMELRSQLRNEIDEQGGLVWTKKDAAQGLMELSILSCRVGTKLESPQEETVRSQMHLVLKARVLKKESRSQVWKSGPVEVCESFPGEEEKDLDPELRQARKKAVELGVERLVNRLRQGF